MARFISEVRRSIPLLIVLIFVPALTFVGCGKDDKPTDGNNQEEHLPPAAPSNLQGEVLSDSSISLTWTDNSSDEVYFAVYRKQILNFLQVGSLSADDTSFIDTGLLENTPYSYYVRAVNFYGSSATSDTVTLTTLNINEPPLTPDEPFPLAGATNQSIYIDIFWNCTDPDDGDTLIYDVYFGPGNQSEPPLVAEGISQTTYDPGTLLYATLYRWRIIAHDNHGNSTSGPLWSFTTQQVP
jgi:hypothetical protein